MKVDKLVPEVYYKESRDFSFAGRLFEVLLNYMKTGSDLVNASLTSENIKGMILDLLISTLGFESKHDYITKDLIYITSAFTELLRNKGTEKAIKEALNILLTSQNLELDIFTSYDAATHTLEIVVPEPLKDIVLFEDLLQYIVPAGILIEAKFGTQVQTKTSDEVKLNDYISVRRLATKNIGKIYTGKEYDLVESGNIPVWSEDESKWNDQLADMSKSLFTTGLVVDEVEYDNPHSDLDVQEARRLTDYKGKKE